MRAWVLLVVGVLSGCDGKEERCGTWYLDGDGDGHGVDGDAVESCEVPDGYAADAQDCDDADPAIYPGAAELCDLIDNDCDELIDEGFPRHVYFIDADSDGYGSPGERYEWCELFPGAADNAQDCDDTDSSISPGAEELCDGIDNDCDELIDDADPSIDPKRQTRWHPDGDGDGYGDAAVSSVRCEAPSGAIEDGADCDDTDPAVRPGAAEVCDNIDNDCDKLIDDADPGLDVSTKTAWYRDADGDGHGDPGVVTGACLAPSGHVSVDTDCDDADARVYPGAVAEDPSLCMLDADGDGYGDDTPPLGVDPGTDCDDTDASISPRAEEVCDSIDNDCDALIDDDDDSLDAATGDTFYADSDGDGYGDASVAADACSVPAGYVADDTDCDDTDSTVYPGAGESCQCDDGVDNDSDGLLDCEDGDCVFVDSCIESDCGDEIDNDNDGIVDCWDDDCWGTSGCTELLASATVTGGNITGQREQSHRSWYWYHNSSGSGRWREGIDTRTTWQYTATNVTGIVELISPALSIQTTCSWALSSATWGAEYHADANFSFYSAYFTNHLFMRSVSRAGFVLSSGCRFSPSADDILPRFVGVQKYHHGDFDVELGELFRQYSLSWITGCGQHWYNTSATRTSSRTHNTSSSNTTSWSRSASWGRRSSNWSSSDFGISATIYGGDAYSGGRCTP